MTIKAELINADRLTPREGEIATLMTEGLSNKAIARFLAISIRTVDAHIASIYEKLDVRSRSINTRCTAILTMVARGMITLSIRSVAVILVFNLAQLDDETMRSRIARTRLRMPLLRMCRNA